MNYYLQRPPPQPQVVTTPQTLPQTNPSIPMVTTHQQQPQKKRRSRAIPIIDPDTGNKVI